MNKHNILLLEVERDYRLRSLWLYLGFMMGIPSFDEFSIFCSEEVSTFGPRPC